MPEDAGLIPEVTDADVSWVCKLMGIGPLDSLRVDFLKSRATLDVSACPGSGKTTLIVAKLAILARKWPHRTRGICVLSHTNVARDQIQHRLGSKGVGQSLLDYPHYIDTIHGFVNRFLAIPWLNSNGFPSPTIGDDVAAAYRRGVLRRGDGLWKIQSFLSRRRKDLSQLRLCDREFRFELDGGPFPAGSASDSYKLAESALLASAKAGFFRYDEMFVWARCLLDDLPDLPLWLAHRFPLVLLDEMQDTDTEQAELLNIAFPRDSKSVVVQRVGDANQRIFQDETSDQAEAVFPDTSVKRHLELSNSYRFGQDIASWASPFAVVSVGPDGLRGLRPVEERRGRAVHAVFVFPNESTNGVLDAYGRHLIEVLGPDLLARGPITAVGHIHRETPEPTPSHQFPKSVCHYWEGYSSETSRKDSYPEKLAQYVHSARALIQDTPSLDCAVDRVAQGILRLARRIGNVDAAKRDGSRPHRTVLLALSEDAAALRQYKDLLQSFLIREGPTLLEDQWGSLQADLLAVASALCVGEVDDSQAKGFLGWSPVADSRELLQRKQTAPNVLRIKHGDAHVDIRLGSIHSVKGQTHVATMLLSTYWHDHSSECILPWLLGHRTNGQGAKSRVRQRLLHTYVAMTRPSHVLCLAIPRSCLGEEPEEHLNTLQSRGWSVAEIVDGLERWRPHPNGT